MLKRSATLLIVFMMIVVCGCATNSYKSYKPANYSQMSENISIKVGFFVNDLPFSDPKQIRHNVHLDRPVSDVVRDAVLSELEAAGYKTDGKNIEVSGYVNHMCSDDGTGTTITFYVKKIPSYNIIYQKKYASPILSFSIWNTSAQMRSLQDCISLFINDHNARMAMAGKAIAKPETVKANKTKNNTRHHENSTKSVEQHKPVTDSAESVNNNSVVSDQTLSQRLEVLYRLKKQGKISQKQYDKASSELLAQYTKQGLSAPSSSKAVSEQNRKPESRNGGLIVTFDMDPVESQYLHYLNIYLAHQLRSSDVEGPGDGRPCLFTNQYITSDGDNFIAYINMNKNIINSAEIAGTKEFLEPMRDLNVPYHMKLYWPLPPGDYQVFPEVSIREFTVGAQAFLSALAGGRKGPKTRYFCVFPDHVKSFSIKNGDIYSLNINEKGFRFSEVDEPDDWTGEFKYEGP